MTWAGSEDSWSTQRKCPMGPLALGSSSVGVGRKHQINAPWARGTVSKAIMPHFHLLDPEAKPQMFSKAQT